MTSSSTPRLMLFDLAIGGHHPSYIRYLVEYWRNEKIAGYLFIVVSPDFLDKHADVASLSTPSIEFVAISVEESVKLAQINNKVIQRAFFEWKIYCKYARSLLIDHSLLMYFDHLQLPIVFGQTSPCAFSGIYFRPTFHYENFDGHVINIKDAWRGWRQKLLLSLTMQEKKMLNLLSLDSYAVPQIKAIIPIDKNVVYLPDPVSVCPITVQQTYEFRQELEIEENRKVFLMFGQLTARKGIYQLIEAINFLSSEITQQCCFLFVGEIPENINTKLLSELEVLGKKSSVQIIVRSEYRSEEEIPLYFSVADFILAPYQKHVGMSGILMLSSAYQKPIIASSYGLLGKMTKDYKLGITVDTCKPRNISQAISAFIESFLEKKISSDNLNQLSSQNTPNAFCSKIFTTLSKLK